MKTNYIGHEQAYKKNRAPGKTGWDRADVSAGVMAQFTDLLQHRDIKQGGAMLELGCGAGNLSIGFAELGFAVTGIDIAPTAIAWAKERALSKNADIAFHEGTVLDLSLFEEGTFDVVVDSHCLHCIISADRTRLLSEAARVLAPNGILIINTMCRNDRTDQLEGFNEESGLVMHGEIATRYIGHSAAILDELCAAGFGVRESFVEQSNEIADELLVIATKAQASLPTREPSHHAAPDSSKVL